MPDGKHHNGHHDGGGDKPHKDHLNEHHMAANYGFALAFMKSDDELYALFHQATRQDWSADKFVAKLRDTKWFKHHSATTRNAILQQTSDPATYQANVDQMFSTVRDSWGQLFGTAGMNHDQMKAWAETAVRMGWSQAQLMDHMTAQIKWMKVLGNKKLGGTAADAERQVNGLVQAYGMDLGKRWIGNQVERIVEGTSSAEAVTNRLREMAKNQYAAFADQIDGGATVDELADPYRQQMAQLLELNPSRVSVNDKMIQRAMRAKSDKGKPAAMDMADFTDMVRRDERWQYTDNAREQAMTVSTNLLRDMGLMA